MGITKNQEEYVSRETYEKLEQNEKNTTKFTNL